MNGVFFNNYLHKTWYIQIELILINTELNINNVANMSNIRAHSVSWMKQPGRELSQWYIVYPRYTETAILVVQACPVSCFTPTHNRAAGEMHMPELHQLHSLHRGVWWQNINYHLLI